MRYIIYDMQTALLWLVIVCLVSTVVAVARNITVTSYWAQWYLKSPAFWLFTDPFIQAQIKENIKTPRHWLLRGEFAGDRKIYRTKGQ